MNPKHFQQLKLQWYRLLALEGFRDIENQKQELKQQDRRTIAFDQFELTRQFYMDLDAYLTHETDVPVMERKILTLYSQGMHLKQISLAVDRSYTNVKQYIRKYREKRYG